jgi:hypothetical protein
MDNSSNYLNIIQTSWKKSSIEKLIVSLEDINFRFLDYDYIYAVMNLKEMPKDPGFKYLARVTEFSLKGPSKDTYDFNLIWAIDIVNRSNRVYTWMNGKKHKQGRKKWDRPKQFNFKPKKKGTKYPSHMSIQDRIDFRRIQSKLTGRGCTPDETAFYNKYAKAVKEVND